MSTPAQFTLALVPFQADLDQGSQQKRLRSDSTVPIFNLNLCSDAQGESPRPPNKRSFRPGVSSPGETKRDPLTIISRVVPPRLSPLWWCQPELHLKTSPLPGIWYLPTSLNTMKQLALLSYNMRGLASRQLGVNARLLLRSLRARPDVLCTQAQDW